MFSNYLIKLFINFQFSGIILQYIFEGVRQDERKQEGCILHL